MLCENNNSMPTTDKEASVGQLFLSRVSDTLLLLSHGAIGGGLAPTHSLIGQLVSRRKEN